MFTSLFRYFRRDRRQGSIPAPVKKEVDGLLADLQAIGWTVSFARYDAQVFGNWYIDLSRDGESIRLTKDRGQFMFSGLDYSDMQSAGLEKAFDRFDDFRHAVSAWAREQQRD